MALTTITITTRDVFHRAPRHGDQVIFRAPRIRPGTGDKVIVPRPVVVSLESGQASAELEPGPCQVSFRAGTSVDSRPFEVVVPDKGPVTLRDLLEKNYEWSPQVVSEVHKALSKAEKAATSAQASQRGAKKAASDARAASDGITALRDQAAQDATRAEGAAAQAAGSATAADASAKEAKTAENRAGTAANRAAQGQYQAEKAARDAASSAEQSEQAAVHAATTKTRATEQADRAKQEADRSKTEADRATTAADRIGTADAVTAARRAAEAAATRSGEQSERSKAEADRAEAAASTATSGISPQVRADIDAKAEKGHKHLSADVTDAVSTIYTGSQKGKLLKVGNDGTIRVTGVDGITSPWGSSIRVDRPPSGPKYVTNKEYVDAADEALGQRIDTKADAAALEQKAAKAQVDQLITALEGKATQAAVDAALAGKVNTVHTHLSAEITDAVDAGAQSQSATYAKRLVRLDASGHLRAKAPATPTSVATKKYVDDEIATATQTGVAASKMAQASAGWAKFYRVGNLVTIQVVNGGSSTAVDIPTGFKPAVRPCYVPVTWLSDPASVVLLNLDRSSGKAQIERAPGTSNAVHGTAVYMTTDAWPST